MIIVESKVNPTASLLDELYSRHSSNRSTPLRAVKVAHPGKSCRGEVAIFHQSCCTRLQYANVFEKLQDSNVDERSKSVTRASCTTAAFVLTSRRAPSDRTGRLIEYSY